MPSRRDLLRVLPASALSAALGPAGAPGSPVRFRLVETAGLRRFGYPVHMTLAGIRVETAGLRRFGYPVHTTLAGIRGGTNFRLTRDGEAVPAQFRPVVGADGEPGVALDFHASPGPLAADVYEVAFGDGVRPGPEPGRGLKVEEAGGVFRVSGTGLVYEVPADLVGFLRRVGGGQREYVRGGSPGFWLRTPGRDGGVDERPGPPLRGSISRRGPLAVGLRFEGLWPVGGGRKAAVVAGLTFPSSKSWVEVTWTVADAEGTRVAGLGLDLDLAVAGPPTLVDLGADGTVYGSISGDEAIGLRGGPAGGAWQVCKTSGQREALQARSRGGPDGCTPRPAEGWAHVMDATRCTAVGVADFGRGAGDRIEVGANGRVRLARVFGTGRPSPRTVRAWFHFVGTPVQVTAVTSPQAMLAPLEVVKL